MKTTLQYTRKGPTCQRYYKNPKFIPVETRRLHERGALHRKHYSYRTEQAYMRWSQRFILSHNKRHFQEMGARAELPVHSPLDLGMSQT